MHFDDRLATTLRLSGGGQAMARIQYRQLIDLLGTLPADLRSDQEAAAYARLVDLTRQVPVDARARALQDPGLRLRNPRLVALLAQGEQSVATAAIGRAELTEEQWLDLAPALPLAVRGVMRQRRDLGPRAEAMMASLGIRDRALPPAVAVQDAQAGAAPSRALPAPVPLPPAPPSARRASDPDWSGEDPEPAGIAALVRKIENFRKARQEAQAAGGTPSASVDPRLPLGDGEASHPRPPARAFDFATDGDGRIVWASTAMAPMVAGIRLGADDPGAALCGAPSLASAFRRRQPIRRETVTLDGAPAISGTWQLDAAPRFDPQGGRFIGYAGRLRRPAEPSGTEAGCLPPAPTEGDRIRQLLHELRTPINAIQGFAEVIQQQLFGPTPHEYRALAAGIAADAARMLAGFQELERLARLETGAMELEAGDCDLADVLATTIVLLEAFTQPRGSGFALAIDGALPPLGIAREESERMVWRLLATLASAAAPGERVDLAACAGESGIELVASLPASLAACRDDELYRACAPAQPQVVSAGMFGSGFALRLVRAEAHAAGGSLRREGERLRLILPGLTGPARQRSQ